MRISDWSSDVCSSDLRLQGLAQAADVHVDRAFLDVDVAAPDVVEQLGARVDALGVGHEEVQQAVLGGADLHRLVVGEHAVGGAVDAQRADGDAAVLVVLARAPRSEEHTSELQSLMRISYAVFCLKKTSIQPNILSPVSAFIS